MKTTGKNHSEANGRRREAEGATRHNDDAWSFELKLQREAHRNIRSLTKKTDTKNDDVLMPMESADSNPMKTVNSLLSDETGGNESLE